MVYASRLQKFTQEDKENVFSTETQYQEQVEESIYNVQEQSVDYGLSSSEDIVPYLKW